MLPIHIGIAKQFNEAIDLLQQRSFIQFRYEIFGILPSTEMFLLTSNDVEGQEVEVGEGQEGKVNKNSIPFLSFGLVLAPEHDSGILVST